MRDDYANFVRKNDATKRHLFKTIALFYAVFANEVSVTIRVS